jgi:hypothetical protein
MKRAGWWGLGVLLTAFTLGAGLRAEQKPGMFGDLKDVTLRGKVVSLGDELARKYGAHVAPGAVPQWGLASPEGQLYSFLETETYRKLVAANLASKAVEVEAHLVPRSMLLEVTSFKALPEAAIQRRYFCDVCTLYADDWGPCVCCGKELQPLPEGK